MVEILMSTYCVFLIIMMNISAMKMGTNCKPFEMNLKHIKLLFNIEDLMNLLLCTVLILQWLRSLQVECIRCSWRSPGLKIFSFKIWCFQGLHNSGMVKFLFVALCLSIRCEWDYLMHYVSGNGVNQKILSWKPIQLRIEA